jgi:hypothetical protein
VNRAQAIELALAYGAEPTNIRAQVADLIAAHGAWHRGVARGLVESPGPRIERARA